MVHELRPDSVFLRILKWQKWQGEAVYDRMRKRKPNGRTKPLTLAYIAIATNLDDDSENFATFAMAVGGGIKARGYLVALLGWIGRNAPTTGVVRCTQDQLGLVLSDRLDSVSRATGAKVWDALVGSGIAEEILSSDVQELSPPSSGNLPGKVPGKVPRHLPGADREGDREGENPPTPLAGGGGASASPPSAIPLNPEDSAILSAIFRRCRSTNLGTPELRATAQRLSDQRRAGSMNPDEARALIDALQFDSPEMAEEARKIRITGTMARKARDGPPVAAKATG